ncbi:unnamed protein product [Rhizophagus irregularis]|nr:unnamed protein product [Rhizophagus irregularis]
MLEKVKFWTIEGRLGISTQYNLLVASFPNKVINKKGLSKAIQQFKKQAKPIKNDTCQMLTELYLKKDDDPRWIIKNIIIVAAILEDETEATFTWILQELKNSCNFTPTVLYSDADPALISAIKTNYPETHHFHCIFHIDLNLKKNLKGKLQDQFELFCARFLEMHNSLYLK